MSEYEIALAGTVLTGTHTDLYEANIAEYDGGRFIVTGRGVGLTIIHADPERRFCYELARLGVPDGPIQFYRADHGGVASISLKSIYGAARHRTDLGDKFPSLEKRDPPMSHGDKIRARSHRRQLQDAVSEAPGYLSTPPKSGRVQKTVECTLPEGPGGDAAP